MLIKCCKSNKISFINRTIKSLIKAASKLNKRILNELQRIAKKFTFFLLTINNNKKSN